MNTIPNALLLIERSIPHHRNPFVQRSPQLLTSMYLCIIPPMRPFQMSNVCFPVSIFYPFAERLRRGAISAAVQPEARGRASTLHLPCIGATGRYNPSHYRIYFETLLYFSDIFTGPSCLVANNPGKERYCRVLRAASLALSILFGGCDAVVSSSA